MQRLVLVHGSVSNGDHAWSAQARLARAYELVIPNRPGFPPGPPVERIDFEDHAAWLAPRLRPGDHLCGHSYGGVVALYAAAQVDGLASLTLIEPPAFALAAGEPIVDAFVARLQALWADGPPEPRSFLLRFYELVAGRVVDLPDPLPRWQEQGAVALMRERGPWEADPPLDALDDLRALVVSGGWSAAFDAVCDVLVERLGAQREVVAGAGHSPQFSPRFNARLRAFLSAA